MRQHGSRMIKIKKADLIAQIEENKLVHIEEYEKAVIAYKKEALKQLANLTVKVNDGEIEGIRLELTKPVDNRENYDKVVEMFSWEVEPLVELSQDEFKEYVQDETQFALSAKLSNSMYLG